ncbi:MAG TPA: ABC transporter permease [Phycisphaerales bacterium]|nr:ABC transporter permease [Phycisphaerales bacterium]HIN83614.1 ABC transporter permease [Phycisphaerales bacterium]HIO52658.1 ABC transporter permease [Phycisphaerales bacterium]
MQREDNQSELNFLLRMIEHWGALWMGVFEFLGGITGLLLDVFKWIYRSIFYKDIQFGRAATVGQIVRIGFRSIGIVCLVCGCIGLILAFQMEPPLATFGQTDKIANIVGVAVLRELGPLISAIVLTGFAGAAIAAELGTMVVGEEIEALEAQALNPIRFLAVPRVIATVISLVLLTIIGDVMAILTACFVSVELLGVPYELYEANTLAQINLSDFTTGLLKAAVFGLILAAIACYNGLRVSGGAAGVGKATTDTVVQTIVTIVITDLLFTAIFYQLGWN